MTNIRRLAAFSFVLALLSGASCIGFAMAALGDGGAVSWLLAAAGLSGMVLGLMSFAGLQSAARQQAQLDQALSEIAEGKPAEPEDDWPEALVEAAAHFAEKDAAQAELRAEKEGLAEEQRQLAQFVAGVDGAFPRAVFDGAGVVTEANEAFAALLGYEPSQVIGRAHEEFLVPDTLEAAAPAEWWAALQAGEMHSDEFERRTRNRETIVVRAVYVPILDQEAKIQRVVAVWIDQTAARKAQKAANDWQGRLFQASVPMAFLDAQGAVTFVNDAFSAMTETYRDEFMRHWPWVGGDSYRGQPFHLVGAGIEDQLAGWAARDEKQWSETLLIGERTFAVMVTPVRDAGRLQTSGYLLEWNDETEVKAAARLAQAADQSQLIIEMDSDGAVLYANDHARSLFGWSSEEARQRSHAEILPRNDAGKAEAVWQQITRSGHEQGVFERVAKSGDVYWIKGSYTKVGGDDQHGDRIILTGSDVTEYVERLEQDRILIAASERSSAVIEFDNTGTILRANENFLSVMGYTEEEIVGRHHRIFMDADEASSAAYTRFWQRLSAGEFFVDRFERRAKDGSTVVIEASYNPVFDANGKVERIVKIAHDVTADTLGRDEAIVKGMAFQNASVPMMITDAEGHVQFTNDALRSFLGHNRSRLGATVEPLIEGRGEGMQLRDLPPILASVGDVLAGGDEFPINIDASLDNDKVNITIDRIIGSGGQDLGRVVEWVDVTTERLATSTIEAMENAQAVIEFKLDGTIVRANPQFLAAVGYTDDEVVGQHHRMFVDPAFADSDDYRQFWEDLGNGKPISGRFDRLGKNQNRVHLQASYTPIRDQAGRPIRVIKVATDMTEIVEQQAREQADRSHQQEQQRFVMDELAGGLKALSAGNFSAAITTEFPAAYEQLRSDFNEAVGKLHALDGSRMRAASDQNDVVERTAHGLERLAEGSLTYTIDEPFPGEYEQLRVNFNAAVVRLREVMEAITATAGDIKTGSTNITQAADDLSNRTENQAATLEQTAAALDQITSTVRQTADGAAQASQVAADAREEAQDSGQVVRDAVSAMGEIEKSSNQINHIISVIDDIAFQTNLLALNAGVEAARAGDAGRGFAVVAQEVRALAQRSSDAAKEIKDLISTSSAQVTHGVDLVGKAGGALGEIVGRVENVSMLVAEIAASAQEQSVSLVEVNTAMNKMDQVTQENAAMVEETTAASHSLAGASATLLERVSHFKTGASLPVMGDVDTRDRSAPKAAVPHDVPDVPTFNGAEAPVRQQREAAEAFFAGIGATAEKLEGDEDWAEF